MVRIFEFDDERNIYKCFVDIDRPEFLGAVAEFNLDGECVNGIVKCKINISQITSFWNRVTNGLIKELDESKYFK